MMNKCKSCKYYHNAKISFKVRGIGSDYGAIESIRSEEYKRCELGFNILGNFIYEITECSLYTNGDKT